MNKDSYFNLPIVFQTLTGSGALLFGEDPGVIIDDRGAETLLRGDKYEYLARDHWIRQLSQ